MYILSINMWFQKLIKQFFFGIDQVVYNLISSIYDLLISIARTSILSQADILDMADRIYKLLAIFMIFKVTLSLITYVVNPDDFSDKSKGISKLTTNIIISLSLLILTPYIFNYAYRLQTIILEDNTMATLIFGDDNKSGNEFINTAGDDMAFITMSAFFTPNVSITKLQNCIDIKGEDGNFNPACSGLDENYNDNSSAHDNSMAALIDNKNFTLTALQNYVAGVEHGNLGLMFRQEMVVATDSRNQQFIMDYKYIFSTVVGVVIILLLITFCMDIALRSIKLAFLQLIAPIPILSYVDPKSGKDGMFKKWYQLCFKTYLSLFIRLLAIYFAVYIISRINKMVDIVDGSYQTTTLVKIFVIIGVLMFAKQLPKILEGLGIKLDGDGKFFLNPLKKFSEQAAGGKQILGAGKGLAAGAMVGTAGMLTGTGVGRGLSATFGGLKSGFQGKKFGEIRKDQATKNAEMRRAIASGSTFWGRRGAQLSGYLGTPGTLGEVEHEKIATQNRIDNFNAQKKRIDNEIEPVRRRIQQKSDAAATLKAMQDRAVNKVKQAPDGEYQKGMAKAAALENEASLKSSLASSLYLKSSEAKAKGNTKEAENFLKEAQRAEKEAKNKAEEATKVRAEEEQKANGKYRDDWLAANISEDGELQNLKEKYENQARVAGLENVFTTSGESFAEALDKQIKTIAADNTKDSTSIFDKEQKIKSIDQDIKETQEILDRLNADEKVAKSNVEVTHSTAGGPARPGKIEQAESTVGRRTGGPGAGMGPMGPMGPGRP
ncbi:MAG: hypothetical protein E7174_01375 [Firmicutes bacterium]|nr:hypothetical protein [Bacillota bacterium]